MPLDVSTIQPGMIIRAAHLTQFFNVLTGIVQDQPISLAHQLSVGGGSVIGPSIVPLVIRSQTAQTANVLEVRDPASDLVFSVSSSGSISLAGTLTTGSLAVTGNASVAGFMVPPLDIGTPNERITNPSLNANSLALLSTDGYVFAEGHSGAYLAGNAFYDGANWNLFDTSQYGAAISAEPGGTMHFYVASPGTNPRTATPVFGVDHSGNVSGNLIFTGTVGFSGNPTFSGTITSSLTISGPFLWLSRGADPAPYTQQRLAVYNDGGNWAYFAYGQDAQMRIVYSSGSAGMLFGVSNAYNNTGTFTQTASLDAQGNLAVRYLSVSDGGNGVISARNGSLYLRTAGGGNSVIMDTGSGGLNVTGGGINTAGSLTAAGYVAAGPAVSGSAGDLSANRNNGTGYCFLANGSHYIGFDGSNYQMPSSLLYVNGDRVVGETAVETLSNKTLVDPHMQPISNGAISNTAVIMYGTGTLTLPPCGSSIGSVRYVKAYGGNISVTHVDGGLFGPGSNAQTPFTVNNGDSVTLVCDGANWWVI